MSIRDLAELRAMLAHGGSRIVEDPLEAPERVPTLTAPPLDRPGDRYRSKTERRYAETILDVGLHAGYLKAWWYEPCKGLYLAPYTSYTVDFLVQFVDGRPLELHEVKGAKIWPKDWQKTKQAAALYPCFRFVRAQWKGGRWQWKEVPAV